MELLDQFSFTRSQRKLLSLLWKEGLEASAHQLHRLSGFGYATVYDALEVLVKGGVVVKSKAGRSNLYSKNANYPEAKYLKQLLGVTLKKKKFSADEVLAHLGNLGAPLGEYNKPKLDLEKEEVLAEGVKLSKENPTLARVLPVVFSKLVTSLNFEKLHYYAQKNKMVQEMGFYLDLSAKVSGFKKLSKEAKVYQDKRVKVPRSFFKMERKSKLGAELEKLNTPNVAKKWNFLMNMGLESFESMYNKSMKARHV